MNAAHQAQELGIKVIETKVARPDDFASRVTVKVKGVVDRLVAGAVFHGDQPRIVRIDDFMLEVIPEGRTLLLHNHDQSGVVGRVGSILGEADINISRMQLALQESRGEACMLVNIDQDPGDAVLSLSAPGCAVGGRNTDEVYPSRLRMARGASGFFGDALALASTSATRLLAPSPRGCADSYTPHASPRGRGASIRRSLCRSTCAL